MKSHILVSNLSYSYDPLEVLKNISFELEQGETLCLIGPSGCGKSTLLQCLAGFIKPSSGNISIANKTIFSKSINVPPEKRNIGLVLQDFSLFPHLNVEQNIKFGMKGNSEKTQSLTVTELMELFRLHGLENKMPIELSGGQQQRVAIARALAPSPNILLFDEPFSNLDPNLREEVRWEVKEILRSINITSIFITHDQIEAFDLGDKIAVLNEGVFHQVGTANELYNMPQTGFVASFIGSGLFLPGTIENGNPNMVKTVVGDIPIENGKCTGAVNMYLPHNSISLSRDGTDKSLRAKVLRRSFLGSYYSYDIGIEKLKANFFNITSHREFTPEESIFFNIYVERLKNTLVEKA